MHNMCLFSKKGFITKNVDKNGHFLSSPKKWSIWKRLSSFYFQVSGYYEAKQGSRGGNGLVRNENDYNYCRSRIMIIITAIVTLIVLAS